jgi:hypothetical protein
MSDVMKLADVYPEPRRLLENERRTLKFLKDFGVAFPDLSTAAREAYFRNERTKRFEFESHIDVEHDSSIRRVLFGATITVNNENRYDNVSYYAALCLDGSGSGKLLRKFHFDLAVPGQIRNRPHPLFHLQYCGTLSRRLEDRGFTVKHMDPSVSEPRLWYSPMSLALLLHCLFLEFRDETTLRFMNRTEWRLLVKKNEDFLLCPYFEKSSSFLRNERKKTRLFMDFLYAS